MGPRESRLREAPGMVQKATVAPSASLGSKGKARQETRKLYIVRGMFRGLQDRYQNRVQKQQAGISFYPVSKKNCRTS